MSLDQPIKLSLNQEEVELIIDACNSVWWDNKQLKTRLSLAKNWKVE